MAVAEKTGIDSAREDSKINSPKGAVHSLSASGDARAGPLSESPPDSSIYFISSSSPISLPKSWRLPLFLQTAVMLDGELGRETGEDIPCKCLRLQTKCGRLPRNDRGPGARGRQPRLSCVSVIAPSDLFTAPGRSAACVDASRAGPVALRQL